MQSIVTAGALVFADTGAFPSRLSELFTESTSDEKWDGPYLVGEEDDWNDEWGRKLTITASESGISILSAGKDGEVGTEDDVARHLTREDALKMLRKDTQQDPGAHSGGAADVPTGKAQD